MSYETRAYDNHHGDPVVVLVATGTHDVSRLVNHLNGASPNCEQTRLGREVLSKVRRHNSGRVALRLLAAHGGPDFSEPDRGPSCCSYEFPDGQRCIYSERHGAGYHLSPTDDRCPVGAEQVIP